MTEHSRYIIDERGTFWSFGDEFKRYIGTRRSDADLTAYCVEKLGYIFVEKRSNDVVFANFVDRIAGPVALISLLQWLHEQPANRFVFNQGGVNAAPNLIPSLEHARKRLSDLAERAVPSATFEVTNIPAEASPFGKVWQVAQEIHTSDMPEPMRLKLLDKLFDGRFTLSERNDATGDFNIKALGSAIRSHQFPDASGYKTFRDMHDREYGRWIADGLKQLSPIERPLFQLVSAPLKFVDRPQRVWHRYSRLLFAPEVEGRQRLLTASVVC